MLRAGKILMPVLRRKTDLAEFYQLLKVSKSSSLKGRNFKDDKKGDKIYN